MFVDLFSFVASLGTIFQWAIRDLSNKLLVLKEHLRVDPVNYRTIQSMIEFEVKSGRTKNRDTSMLLPDGKALPNGSRTLLRLHRALAFISLFLSQMRIAPDDASSADIACNCYSMTMARYHTWIAKKTYVSLINIFFFLHRTIFFSLFIQHYDRYSIDITISSRTSQPVNQ